MLFNNIVFRQYEIEPKLQSQTSLKTCEILAFMIDD